MDGTKIHVTGYSPEVSIWMECGISEIVPLRQAAPTFVIPFEPRHLHACDVVIVTTVDGKRFERPVHFAGMNPDQIQVPVYSRDGTAPF